MVVAFQHCEFIGHESAIPLLAKADIADDLDGGTIILPGEEGLQPSCPSAASFGSAARACAQAWQGVPAGE